MTGNVVAGLVLWAIGAVTGFALARGPAEWRRTFADVRATVCRLRGHRAHDLTGCCPRCGKLIAMVNRGIG